MNEEQRDEIEALGSIFGDDFELISETSHRIFISPYPGKDNPENHGNISMLTKYILMIHLQYSHSIVVLGYHHA